jgi:universal stress protein A
MIEYPKYKKVLFCTDFSENADCAFDYAFGIAKRDDAVLYIVHVTPSNPEGNAILSKYATETELSKIQENLRKDLAQKFNDRYLIQIRDQAKVKIVTKSGNAYEEILRFAMEEGIDLITIGTHGKTGLEHVFLGNIAEKIVRYSPVPVFIIPCKGKSSRDLFR